MKKNPWNGFLNEKEFIIEYQKGHLKDKKEYLKNNYINTYDNSIKRRDLKPLQISPTLQINNYPKDGYFIFFQ